MKFGHLLALAISVSATYGQGTISTYAGTGTCCNSADGRPAASSWLQTIKGIAFDRQGNLYLWETGPSRVRKVNTAGVISTVAGNGSAGYTGDGGPAISASLFANGSVSGLAVDDAGNLFISDGQNHVIRKVNAAGVITTVAGNGSPGFSGDGGAATAAQLQYPSGIALDSAGNLYIADSSNNRVRRVNAAGVISTFAGNGNSLYSGDGVAAASVAVSRPEGLTVDSAGNVYIAETSEARIRRVNSAGVISTVAGQTKKTTGFSGDGGPATAATLSGPLGMAADRSGNLYLTDSGRIRKVDAAGIITTIAGVPGNSSSPLGDGGPATAAYLGATVDLAFDPAGNLYVAGSASGASRVRKITASAGLTVSPGSLSFSYSIGGTAPGTQSVAVSGASAGFTASASTTSGGNWLSVSPSSGSLPANLAVAVNPTGIAGGVYQGAVTVTPAGGSPQSFAVTLTISGAGAPVFSAGAVYNALGYQNKLAPGAVFVVFGSGMGPASLAAAAAPNYPTTLEGTSISLTPAGGGAAVNARIVYTVAGQVAGLLPSSMAPGTYAMRVTYNTLASAPQNVTVVARSFGIATVNSAGSGTAQATIGNVNGGVSLTRFTSGSTAFSGLTWTLTPAHPGDTLVLWGTGGGADSANDTGGTSGDQTASGSFRVIVSGRQITPLYAGASSGYPGLWQINFVLPSDAAPDCFAPVQVSAGGELSNAVTIPIAASGETACSDPQLSRDALAGLDAGGTVALGGFIIARTTLPAPLPPAETSSGGIAVYSASAYAALSAGRDGPCTVSDRTAAATDRNPAAPEGFLDAGSPLPLSGPGIAAGAGLTVASTNPGPVYNLTLPNGSVTAAGRYTLSAPGGRGLRAFTASVNFPASFTVSNWDALTSIDRGRPLVLNWTSSGAEQVVITGGTSSVVGRDSANNNIVHNVSFTCTVPATPGTFTVPANVVGRLLPVSTPTGVLAVQAVNTAPFAAPLTAGGQAAYASFSAIQAYSRSVTVQ